VIERSRSSRLRQGLGLAGWLAVAFAQVSRTAAALLLPYLAWVTFAAGLNFSLWRLNPSILG
jgi:translocator protein